MDTTGAGVIHVAHFKAVMTPDFNILLTGGVFFSLCVLSFMVWRFGGPDTLAFVVVAGLFPAVMDFLSSFVVHNYEYPGQSRLWVFSYIFFGWIAVCGTCMLIAEGILVTSGEDMLVQSRLWWQVPLLTGTIAVVLDLFIDPIAVAAGYWVWFVPGKVYYGIPLLNFVGWFVLMTLAPFAWILIVRRRTWGYGRKAGLALAALLPLFVASVALSIALNRVIAGVGLQ